MLLLLLLLPAVVLLLVQSENWGEEGVEEEFVPAALEDSTLC